MVEVEFDMIQVGTKCAMLIISKAAGADELHDRPRPPTGTRWHAFEWCMSSYFLGFGLCQLCVGTICTNQYKGVILENLQGKPIGSLNTAPTPANRRYRFALALVICRVDMEMYQTNSVPRLSTKPKFLRAGSGPEGCIDGAR